MTYLLDNSVLQRVHRQVSVAEALAGLLPTGDLGSCLPQLLEEGYSARSAEGHRRIMEGGMRAKVFLPPDARVAHMSLEIQGRLFAAGIGRSVGVSDLQIAATAICHSTDDRPVIVVHYDRDFEHVASVAPEFRQQWIVPRGSVP